LGREVERPLSRFLEIDIDRGGGGSA